LLRHAVSSVLAQSHKDFEIIISDNASEDDYQGYIQTLSDSRVVYYRYASSVPVTANWRKALSLATGDYVLMLGDDDALAPQFSEIVLPHLSPNGPDVAYLAAYHYCYPGVIPGSPHGYFAAVKCEFLQNDPGVFNLAPEYAHELAASVLDFRHRYNFNGQHFLLRRHFAESFAEIGGLYQSPYPDFFAAIATFYRARSILVLPQRAVIIGISPKSFGAYYFSHRQSEGYKFLDNEYLDPGIRDFAEKAAWPGDMNNTNWLIAAEMARRALSPSTLPNVNIDRYRSLQIVSLLRGIYCHRHSLDKEVANLRMKMSTLELVSFDFLRMALDAVARRDKMLPLPVIEQMELELGQYPAGSYTMMQLESHESISDAFDWLTRHRQGAFSGSGVSEPATAPTTGGAAFNRILSTLRLGPRAIARGVARRTWRAARRAARLVRSLFRESARDQTALPEKDQRKLRIVVKRGSEQCVLTPGLFDDFEFQEGDELSVIPTTQASKLIKTPDANIHILSADGRGIRVPQKMEFTLFRGYRMPEHLVRLTGAGSETFESLGKGHLANYRKYMGIEPGMSFLEIGSGMGRDAFQLIDALGPTGRYIGIDVQRESIAWCQKNISRDHPNFHFYHFNAKHELHNPLGSKTTLDYPLPAPDHSIDRVALQSVLTHIFEDEVVHYLSEIARVLKPTGLAYVTFLLYSEEIVAASRKNDLTPYGLRFEHKYGDGCYINNLQYPTGGVAYTDDAMKRMIERSGLRLTRPYLKGWWSGYHAEPDDDGQDVAILGPVSVSTNA